MEVIFRFGGGPISATHSMKHRTREGIHIVSQQPELQRRVLHFSHALLRIFEGRNVGHLTDILLTLWRRNFILAHPVYKMLITQEPKKVAL